MLSPYDIILAPVITEKSMDMIQEQKYTFKVLKTANKAQIKEAIEKAFDGVKVKSVNTMNMRGKTIRTGMRVGKRSDWKKAIVTLAEGSEPIEYFEGL